MYNNINNKKFNLLTAISFSYNKRGNYYWLFKCDCGQEKITRIKDVMKGKIKSCGCFGESIKNRAKPIKCPEKVNRKKIERDKTYNAWARIRQRCYNSNDKAYKRYGARGITVCDRWKDFNKFLEDMGKPPGSKYSIDRIDNDGNYEPSNCKWATMKEQARNRRNNRLITYQGDKKILIEWCEKLGLKYSTTLSRLDKYKWSVEKAFSHSDIA